MVSARRDPRLARRHPPPLPVSVPVGPVLSAAPAPAPAPAHIAPNVFDIKPLERAVTKRKNVITIDVRTDVGEVRPTPRDSRPRDLRVPRDATNSRPQRDSRRERARARRRDLASAPAAAALTPAPTDYDVNTYIEKLQLRKINKLPPIPKINRDEQTGERDTPAPPKRRKEGVRDRKKKGEPNKEGGSAVSSPEKRGKNRENRKKREPRVDPGPEEAPGNEIVQFKELKNYHKEHYMRRNKEKSESPERVPEPEEAERQPADADADASSKITVNVSRMRG